MGSTYSSSSFRLSGINSRITSLKMELLQHTSKLLFPYTPVNEKFMIRLPPFSGASMLRQKNHCSVLCLSSLRPFDLSQAKSIRPPLMVLFESKLLFA